jgi:hypothetical protein
MRVRRNRDEVVTLNRIARAGQNQATPTDGLRSTTDQLGDELSRLFDHGLNIAGRFHVGIASVFEEMVRRAHR